jgi:6-phosphogluconolactonase
MSSSPAAPVFVYVGTFTRGPHGRGRAEGISVFRYDPDAGALRHVQTLAGVANPSFLALHPHRPYLYAVNAVPEQDGRPGGSVSAFAIDPAGGTLTYLNRQPTHGAGPCHVSVDQTGRWVLSASYGGGSVAMFPVEADGRLGPPSDFIQHEGSSVVPERQAGPHAHSITIDPANRYALVCDLGLDRVIVYRLDLERGKLLPNDPPWVAAAPGAGPRHLDFHPNGRLVYVINEINSTLTTYAYDAAAGRLQAVQTLSTLPAGFSGVNSTADVHVAPSGRFVYGSNRGHDSLACYAVDAATGTLSLLGHEPTRGRTPRNFAFDPAGAFLLAANQDTDTIVTFRVDPASGRLAPAGPVTETPTPVCIKFWQAGA